MPGPLRCLLGDRQAGATREVCESEGKEMSDEMKLRAALSVATKALERFACFALEENDLRIMMISLSAKGLSDADRDYRIEYGKIREETQAALAEPTITLEAARIRHMEESLAQVDDVLASHDIEHDRTDYDKALKRLIEVATYQHDDPQVSEAARIRAMEEVVAAARRLNEKPCVEELGALQVKLAALDALEP
jgi:hypothetical protein